MKASVNSNKWRNKLWDIYTAKSLEGFDTEVEAIKSFMDVVVDKGFSMRVKTVFKTVFYAEIVEGFERHSMCKIDGKGQIFKAKPGNKTWTIDHYIDEGKWVKETEGSYFDDEII